MGDTPPFNPSEGLLLLLLLMLAIVVVLVLLTGWTAWCLYRQPTIGRLVGHGVLLQLWLWAWTLAGPDTRELCSYWLLALLLAHVLFLVGRGVAQRQVGKH